MSCRSSPSPSPSNLLLLLLILLSCSSSLLVVEAHRAQRLCGIELMKTLTKMCSKIKGPSHHVLETGSQQLGIKGITHHCCHKKCTDAYLRSYCQTE